ncbi:Uncharacterised protein [uncultured archaeon]|nr:Uncharacterised protein [uncultured archaeon]
MVKDEKVYEEQSINFILRSGGRKELRDAIVIKFLEEKGGYWKEGVKHVTRFRYYVETLADGRRVFLFRPTHLNKGIDFQVWVEKFQDDKDGRPSHKDVFADLKGKNIEDSKKCLELAELINRVWLCEDPDDVLKGNSLVFKSGWSVEMLLKILKWLFIEQDITYWNYDGRGMLWSAIREAIKPF